MKNLKRTILLVLAMLVLAACDSDSEPSTSPAPEVEPPGDGDGDGDLSGDGDGDGDGDNCSGVDSHIPSDCGCVAQGEPCFEECAQPDPIIVNDTVCDDAGVDDDGGASECSADAITCNDVCGAGRCAQNGCGGKTWFFGVAADECGSPSDHGSTMAGGCDEPIPFLQPGINGPELLAVTCCCD